jgi:hypothetical protein
VDGVVLVLVLPFVLSPFWLSVANRIGIAIIGAIGLNILTGFTGQISLGQGGFLAVGAYTSGLLVVRLGLPTLVAIVLAVLFTALVGALLRLPACGSRASTWRSPRWRRSSSSSTWCATGSSSPRAGLDLGPTPELFGFVLIGDFRWYWDHGLRGARDRRRGATCSAPGIGRAFMAVRDQDIAAEALGVNLTATRCCVRGLVRLRRAGRRADRSLPHHHLGAVHARRLDRVPRDDHRRRARQRSSARSSAPSSSCCCRPGSSSSRSASGGSSRGHGPAPRAPAGDVRARDHPVPDLRATRAGSDVAAHQGLLPPLAVPVLRRRHARESEGGRHCEEHTDHRGGHGCHGTVWPRACGTTAVTTRRGHRRRRGHRHDGDGEAGTGDPIVIGGIFDLSGATGDVGTPYSEGARDYVDWRNSTQDGVGGRRSSSSGRTTPTRSPTPSSSTPSTSPTARWRSRAGAPATPRRCAGRHR